MNKLSFAGHETFTCKQFWLKKGYDFISEKKGFNDKEAVTSLGVGKNMVNAIQFWMKAFGLLEENHLSEFANYIFSGDKGKDPFLEDIGTIWLLHYQLIKQQRASIYALIFNDFIKETLDFNKSTLVNFLLRKSQLQGVETSIHTLDADVSVFVRGYLKPNFLPDEKVDIEEIYVGLMLELNLLKSYKKMNLEGKETDWYKIPRESRPELPFQIVLYSILDSFVKENNSTISYKDLKQQTNSPMFIFGLTEEGFFEKIQEITNHYKGQIVFSDSSGVQSLQFKNSINSKQVLDDYYNQI